jgi:hypothetical protein
MEGLDSVPWGEDVRQQAQMVPLTAAASIAAAPAAPAAPAIAADDVVATSYETQKRRDIEAMRTVMMKSGRSR